MRRSGFSIDEIVSWTKAECLCRGRRTIVRGALIDSRGDCRGRLFIALKGRFHDGHDYACEADAKGAAAVLVDRDLDPPVRPSAAWLKVKDCPAALLAMTRGIRRLFRGEVIALTGTSGKTTTKEYIAAVLQGGRRVLVSPGNHNNHIGVPLSWFSYRPGHHDTAVMEIATNRTGDIRLLTNVIDPTAAVLLNIGPGHLEGLRSVDQVFREKTDLIRGMRHKGWVLLNVDDERLKRYRRRIRHHKVYGVGRDRSADFKITDVERIKGGWRFAVGRLNFTVRGWGRHHVTAAAVAVAAGRIFGLSGRVIQSGLNKVTPPAHRQQLLRFEGTDIIDDTYNANPVSSRLLLENAADHQVNGRRILIMAPMEELGHTGIFWHRQLGEWAAACPVDVFWGCGPRMEEALRMFHKMRPQAQARWFRRKQDLLEAVRSLKLADDLVMVKGSRLWGMEDVVNRLCESVTGR